MKFLFLLNEPTDYFFNSIEFMCKQKKNHSMVILKNESKYQFNYSNYSFAKNVIILKKLNELELMSKIKNFNCDIIFTCNYHFKIYRKIFKNFNGKVILGTDNLYRNTFKQFLSRFISRFYLLPYFDYIMIPLKRGKHLIWAKKMGFKKNQIIDNFYSACHTFYKQKKLSISKNFMFLGRFENEKGIRILIEAYKVYRKKNYKKNLFKLNLYGTGSLKDYIIKEIKETKGINLKGMVKYEEKKNIFKFNDFLILPSIYEPFGVVTHESLCSSRPVIISDVCGSSKLIKNNFNGFVFKSNSILELVKIMEKVSNFSNKKIIKLFKNSYLSSFQINNQKFCNNLTKIY